MMRSRLPLASGTDAVIRRRYLYGITILASAKGEQYTFSVTGKAVACSLTVCTSDVSSSTHVDCKAELPGRSDKTEVPT